MTLRQVGGFSRPVVHLGVDIDRYLLSQGGVIKWFQIPCRLAGCDPGRDDEINR